MMRRIELSSNDVELFDSDLAPQLAEFFHRHRDAFRQMKVDQGKEFWTRFLISFRNYSTNNGTIKDIPYLCEKMDAIYDLGFILIHNEFVDGKPNAARNFITDVIMVARNQNNFPSVEMKQTRAHDLFYIKETREVFRRFFGSPEHAVSYMTVYILAPVLIKFGGAVCICLKRWLQAGDMDPCDTSYWTPPNTIIKSKVKPYNKMCVSCFDTLVSACFRERVHGDSKGPKHLAWKYGDPRKNDPQNPLYDDGADCSTDWREGLTFSDFNVFFQYVQQTSKSHHVIADCDCADFMESHDKEGSFDSKIFIIEATEKISSFGRLQNLSEKARNERIKVEKIKKKSNKESGVKPQEKCKKSEGCNESNIDSYDDDPSKVLQELIALAPLKDTKVGLCEVMHILDEETGNSEVIITTTPHDMMAADFTDLYTYFPTQFPITEKFLMNKFDHTLPKNFKWTECGNVAVSFDYTAEESGKTDKPTNFRLVMKCRDECRLKWLMIYMVDYVNKRKKRDSPGWTLTSDDILVNMLPNLRSSMWEGVCIRIQQGLDTDDLLPDNTGHRPYIRSTRTCSQIFGKNPVHGDTWNKLPDGSLRLIDESGEKPLALSKLKKMVEKLQSNLKTEYRQKRSLVSKIFYAVASKKILSLTLTFSLRQDFQRKAVTEFSKMCNLAISNLSRVLTETPSIDPVPICHKASEECISKLLKLINQLKKLQNTNGFRKSPTGAQSSNIIEKLHDYCKGMAVRTHFSEEIGTDEEDAACEAVVDTLCGERSSATNSASKASEPNVKSTKNSTGGCGHNHCPKRSHLCDKCHKPKVMSCEKHGSSAKPAAAVVNGDSETALKSLSAVSEKIEPQLAGNAEKSATSTGNQDEAFEYRVGGYSVAYVEKGKPAPESPVPSFYMNDASPLKGDKIQIRIRMKKVPKANIVETTSDTDVKAATWKASSWHDAVQDPLGMSSTADKMFAPSSVSEKKDQKKNGKSKEENIQNAAAELVLKKMAEASQMSGDISRLNDPRFERDEDVEREMEQWLDTTMFELGLTNPLDLIKIAQTTAGAEMLGDPGDFLDHPAVQKWVARRLGIPTDSTDSSAQSGKEAGGKKKKKGRRGRSGNASALPKLLNLSSLLDPKTRSEASGTGIRKENAGKKGIVDEGKADAGVEKVTEQKQEGSKKKQKSTEKNQECTEKKPEVSELKEEIVEKQQEVPNKKQEVTAKKQEVTEKKQKVTEQKQKGTDSKQQMKNGTGSKSVSEKVTEKISKTENGSQDLLAKKLKICAACGSEEPKPKTFKKCQKCRTEGVENARYYCGRDCQVSDWGERHKGEHRNQSFP